MPINLKATALHNHVGMLHSMDVLELTKCFMVLDIKYSKF